MSWHSLSQVGLGLLLLFGIASLDPAKTALARQQNMSRVLSRQNELPTENKEAAIMHSEGDRVASRVP